MTEPEKREKVINGLEWALENMVDPSNDFRFAGYDGPIVLLNEPIVRDAIALLKAQEPVAPVRKSFLVSAPNEYGITSSMTVCGACDAWLLTVEPRAKYCPNCGRAVKWE